ncbi:MAG: phosphate acyltransferase PlsX [Oscillospiraceae bacterium]
MKIAIDAFGGDDAPLEIIKGASEAREFRQALALVGDIAEIERCAAQNGIDISGIEIVGSSSVMDMNDEAKAVLKSKSDSSMGVGLRLVAEGGADAFVSAGPTGALLMGSTLLVRRIKGVKRPALCVVLPGKTSTLLIDCGANAECRPEMLVQFGVMGSQYMQAVVGTKEPRVALANNGAEESKGTELQIESYKLLAARDDIRFVGNIEGRDILLGACDVVVSDGFTGNIILKTVEGASSMLFSELKGVFYQNILTKLAAAALKPALRQFKNRMDYTKYGGAPIIGLQKPVIKAHGSSNAQAIKNAVRQAIAWGGSDMGERIARAFETERHNDGD